MDERRWMVVARLVVNLEREILRCEGVLAITYREGESELSRQSVRVCVCVRVCVSACS